MQINLGNVRGPQGATGPQGETGARGADGLTPYISNGTWWIGTVDTGVTAKGNEWFYGTENPEILGQEGDLYLNTNTCDVWKKINGIWAQITNIKGSQGEKGDKGDRGDTALTFAVGEVFTAEAGEEASVENVGTGVDIVLNFTIPKGEQGEQGEQGRAGGSVVYVSGSQVASVSFSDDPQDQLSDLKIYKEDKANKVEEIDVDAIDNFDKYPSVNAVILYVDGLVGGIENALRDLYDGEGV